MKRSASGLEIAKPLFLTKSERESLALERRQAAVSDRRHSAIDLLRSVPRPASPPPLPTHPSRDRDRGRRGDRDSPDRDRDRGRRRDRDDSSRRERERGKERRVRERRPDSHMEREQDRNREADRLEKIAEREREKELEAIKEQYLGSKKPKKRVIKPSEEFLFSFDWENNEDTSRDMNTLYQSPHEARLLFGRGFLAGVDRREQKKVAAQHEKEIRAELRRKASGAEESPEEDDLVDKKKAAADSYDDAFDMRVDRHWSEKSAEEMTERDWRIFHEDFNIAYKGTRIPRPMRNWSERKLGAELLDAVEAAGCQKPSPIQMAAIPLV